MFRQHNDNNCFSRFERYRAPFASSKISADRMTHWSKHDPRYEIGEKSLTFNPRFFLSLFLFVKRRNRFFSYKRVDLRVLFRYSNREKTTTDVSCNSTDQSLIGSRVSTVGNGSRKGCLPSVGLLFRPVWCAHHKRDITSQCVKKATSSLLYSDDTSWFFDNRIDRYFSSVELNGNELLLVD